MIILLCTLYSIFNIFLLYNIVASISILVSYVLIILCIDMKLPFLTSGCFQMIAEISYPCYLIHQNIGYVILLNLKNTTGYLLALVITVLSSFLLGVLIYYYERKLEKKSKKKCLSI